MFSPAPPARPPRREVAPRPIRRWSSCGRRVDGRSAPRVAQPAKRCQAEPSSAGVALAACAESLRIEPDQLDVMGRIGSGVTAEVFQGFWRGGEVAVKRMASDERTSPIIERELSVMARVQQHQNLVQLLAFCQSGPSFDVILELCTGGTLFELLHVSDQEVSFAQQLKIAQDVAQGMEHLHSLAPPVVHRDLKSLNVLLSAPITSFDDVPLAKVADFGMARVRKPSRPHKTHASGQRRRGMRKLRTLPGPTLLAQDPVLDLVNQLATSAPAHHRQRRKVVVLSVESAEKPPSPSCSFPLSAQASLRRSCRDEEPSSAAAMRKVPTWPSRLTRGVQPLCEDDVDEPRARRERREHASIDEKVEFKGCDLESLPFGESPGSSPTGSRQLAQVFLSEMSSAPSGSPAISPSRKSAVTCLSTMTEASGCSRRFSRTMTSRVGTLQWMSPELLSGSTCYDGLVDVYAYGMLLYEIMCFEPPFADLDLEDVEAAVLAGERPDIDPEAMPDDLAQLAQACWSQEAGDRPTFTAVVSALEKLKRETLWTAIPEKASSADHSLSSLPDFY